MSHCCANRAQRVSRSPQRTAGQCEAERVVLVNGVGDEAEAAVGVEQLEWRVDERCKISEARNTGTVRGGRYHCAATATCNTAQT